MFPHLLLIAHNPEHKAERIYREMDTCGEEREMHSLVGMYIPYVVRRCRSSPSPERHMERIFSRHARSLCLEMQAVQRASSA